MVIHYASKPAEAPISLDDVAFLEGVYRDPSADLNIVERTPYERKTEQNMAREELDGTERNEDQGMDREVQEQVGSDEQGMRWGKLR